MFNYTICGAVGVIFLHLTVDILTARDAGRLLAISVSEKKANANTFLAYKNQWMVLVSKMLDPTSERRV